MVNVFDFKVMLSSPTNFNDNIKSKFLRLLLEELHVPGVNMVSQTLLALYMYNASSGIVVDVGERIEILPVTDGQCCSHIAEYLYHTVQEDPSTDNDKFRLL